LKNLKNLNRVNLLTSKALFVLHKIIVKNYKQILCPNKLFLNTVAKSPNYPSLVLDLAKCGLPVLGADSVFFGAAGFGAGLAAADAGAEVGFGLAAATAAPVPLAASTFGLVSFCAAGLAELP